MLLVGPEVVSYHTWVWRLVPRCNVGYLGMKLWYLGATLILGYKHCTGVQRWIPGYETLIPGCVVDTWVRRWYLGATLILGCKLWRLGTKICTWVKRLIPRYRTLYLIMLGLQIPYAFGMICVLCIPTSKLLIPVQNLWEAVLHMLCIVVCMYFYICIYRHYFGSSQKLCLFLPSTWWIQQTMYLYLYICRYIQSPFF
jgi:hypothetical protein